MCRCSSGAIQTFFFSLFQQNSWPLRPKNSRPLCWYCKKYSYCVWLQIQQKGGDIIMLSHVTPSPFSISLSASFFLSLSLSLSLSFSLSLSLSLSLSPSLEHESLSDKLVQPDLYLSWLLSETSTLRYPKATQSMISAFKARFVLQLNAAGDWEVLKKVRRKNAFIVQNFSTRQCSCS